jgi:hypothetical protein
MNPALVKIATHLMKLVKSGKLSEKAAHKIYTPIAKTIRSPKHAKQYIKRKLQPYKLKHDKRVARRRVRKDLLSNSGFKRYQRHHIDNINKQIAQYKQDYKVMDMADQKQFQGRIKELLAIEQKKLKHANSAAFRKEYNEIVGSQIDNVPLKMKNIPRKHGASGLYRRPQGRNMGKQPTGDLEDITNPFKESPDFGYGKMNYRIISDRHAKGKPRLGRKERAEQLGEIHVEKRIPSQRRRSTGAHEVKHGVQSVMPEYIDDAYKYVPKDKLGRPLIIAEAELEAAVLGGKAGEKVIGNAKYFSSPWEIGARLTQYRTEPMLRRILWENGIVGKPGFYNDLMKVFKTTENINKAAKHNWAMAGPMGMGGLLGMSKGDE